jgi:PIN domain nuclease of toxin-antitoxin system
VIVVDTHAWLWWLAAPEKLSAAAGAALEREGEVGVATISCWEVAMLAAKGRISLDVPVRTWVGRALAGERVRPLPLTPQIAVDAGLLDDAFPGDPADRILFATARQHGARLLTRDRALREFDPAATLW